MMGPYRATSILWLYKTGELYSELTEQQSTKKNLFTHPWLKQTLASDHWFEWKDEADINYTRFGEKTEGNNLVSAVLNEMKKLGGIRSYFSETAKHNPDIVGLYQKK